MNERLVPRISKEDKTYTPPKETSKPTMPNKNEQNKV
jgi:hypothetical protein